ncbi:GTPase [Aeoliella mucimassa]|uniref:tRNA modification GTPase MnmE n=1 Tax=Aeoliella mucimassa TaxID=2527972 RepID=A0A518AVJ6_9BACT|nr:GTPase [Aeoliella mucimassa]QDU58728.1 tRNA modification GTPase MnmE [Aeoliella mucimassa]
MTATDTTVCLLTADGRGAVAVLAVEGPGADSAVARWFRSASGWQLAKLPLGRIAFGRWAADDGEEVVIVRTESGLEIQCHGGIAASRAIVQSLVESGVARLDSAGWQQQHARDSIAAQAAERLGLCATERAALVLLDQYNGALRAELEQAIAAIERGDYSQAEQQLSTLAKRWEVGRILTTPARVVLTGPPNVGKSSLINALVGYQRAIVFDTPGTTRDVVTASTAIEGWAVDLVDTAGLRQATDGVEQSGIELAQAELANADLVVLVGEAEQWLADQPPAFEFAQWFADRPTVRVANKCDRLTNQSQELLCKHASELILTSAIEPHGAAPLLEAIAGRVVPSMLEPQAAVPFTLEQQQAILAACNLLTSNQPETAALLLQALL